MTSKKNIGNNIMKKENKKQLKERIEQLKTIKDAINYQKLLLSTERKRKNKKEISERIKRYQNKRKDLESKIKEHPVTVERKERRAANKKLHYDCDAILFHEISKEEYEQLHGHKKSSIVKRHNPEEYYKIWFKQRVYHVTAKAQDDFRIKKDNEMDKQGRVYRDSPNWTKTRQHYEN